MFWAKNWFINLLEAAKIEKKPRIQRLLSPGKCHEKLIINRGTDRNFHKQMAILKAGVEKVSDHGTIGPRKSFEFPENISPRKKKKIVVKIWEIQKKNSNQ